MVNEDDRPVALSGRYFEDFQLGDRYQHPLGRTITSTDNTWFTLLTMNTNQLHFNEHYAAQSMYRRPLVNSGFTVALVLGISVSDISQNAMANLGWTDIKLVNPVFVGDTIYAETLITELRESRSRKNAGIVSCFTRGINQDGDVVLSFTRSVMVYRKSYARAVRSFPGPRSPLALPDDSCEQDV